MPPLLPITIALIIGILLQYSGLSAIFTFIPVCASAILAFKKFTTAAIVIMASVLGFTISSLHAPLPFNGNLSKYELKYSGVIKEIKEFDSSRTLIVSIDSCSNSYCHPILAKIFIPSTLPMLDETERIEFTAKLTPLQSATYLPDEIDYNRPLRQQGVTAEALIEPEDITCSYYEPGILNSIFRFRMSVTRVIATTSLSPDAKNFLITILTGDKSYLTSDSRDIFSHTGLAHILALSGLHVGILSWLIFITLLPLHLTGARRLRIFITIIILWLFAMMTGLSPSVVRAVIMATLFLIATMLERVRNPFNSLCFAAIIILLFSPNALFTIGFQLSFISVATILLFAEKINFVKPDKKIAHTAVSYITVSLAAMLGTGIVSAYYFGIFPIYFIIANVVASLLLPILLGTGIIIVFAGALGIATPHLCIIADKIYEAMESTAEWIASLPGAYIDGFYLTPIAIPMYFLALLFWGLYLYKRRQVWIISATAIIAVSFLIIKYDKPKYTAEALYIPPSYSETSIILKESTMLWLITTAHNIETDEIKTKLERKYQKYMSRREIDSISILPELYKSNSGSINRNGNLFYAKGKTFLIVNSPDHLKKYPLPIDFAIVTKGFRGDIIQLHDSVMPDTIVLSADIHLQRHNRYAKELTAAKIPHKELRREPLIMN